MTDIECRTEHWGTVSGLDPELVKELRRAKEARELRESEALALDQLKTDAARRQARKWLGRIAAALGIVPRGLE